MAFSLDLKRVLISDSVDNCCKTILEANGIAVDLKTKLTKEELLAEIPVCLSKYRLSHALKLIQWTFCVLDLSLS